MKTLLSVLAALTISTTAQGQIIEKQAIDDSIPTGIQLVRASEEEGLKQLSDLALTSRRGMDWFYVPDSTYWIEETYVYDDSGKAIPGLFYPFAEKVGNGGFHRYSLCKGELACIEETFADNMQPLWNSPNGMTISERASMAYSIYTALPNSTDLYKLFYVSSRNPKEDHECCVISRIGKISYKLTDKGIATVSTLDPVQMGELAGQIANNMPIRYLFQTSKFSVNLAPDLEKPMTKEEIEKRTALYSSLSDSTVEISYTPLGN